MADNPKLFAQLGGWRNLTWNPEDPDHDPLPGLFPQGGALLLGTGENDLFTLTWLDEDGRWHSVPGFFLAGVTTDGASPSLASQATFPRGGKEPYELRLTLRSSQPKPFEPPQLTLTGHVYLPSRGDSSGPVGHFTSHADPMGNEEPVPVFRRFLRWLQRFFHRPAKPREPRRLAP